MYWIFMVIFYLIMLILFIHVALVVQKESPPAAVVLHPDHMTWLLNFVFSTVLSFIQSYWIIITIDIKHVFKKTIFNLI